VGTQLKLELKVLTRSFEIILLFDFKILLISKEGSKRWKFEINESVIENYYQTKQKLNNSEDSLKFHYNVDLNQGRRDSS